MGRLVPTVLFSSVDSKERFKKGFPCFEAILKTTDVRLPSHTNEETGQHAGRQAWWRRAGLERDRLSVGKTSTVPALPPSVLPGPSSAHTGAAQGIPCHSCLGTERSM